MCATFLEPNHKGFQCFEKYEKKKYLKSVKEFLSDFYLAKRVSEITPIKKVTNESKKFKLSFDDEEDDSGSYSDKNVSLDLKKEITEYIKLSVHEHNVLEISKSTSVSNIVLYFNDDFMYTWYQCTK